MMDDHHREDQHDQDMEVDMEQLPCHPTTVPTVPVELSEAMSALTLLVPSSISDPTSGGSAAPLSALQAAVADADMVSASLLRQISSGGESLQCGVCLTVIDRSGPESLRLSCKCPIHFTCLLPHIQMHLGER
jgi:hypothetical protein